MIETGHSRLLDRLYAFARGESGFRPALLAVVGLFLGSACAAPTAHVPEPWASDAAAATRLTERAAARCVASGRNGGVQPVLPFVTDGCSRFPDTEWNTACCVEHDLAYWCGGTEAERAEADAAFGTCVAEGAGAFMGWLMEAGVRVGGHPVFPSSYRWGYGHPYTGGYPSAGDE
ncbi:MAG: hypothetical protein AAGC67_20060 [Myxococcota bacterium]